MLVGAAHNIARNIPKEIYSAVKNSIKSKHLMNVFLVGGHLYRNLAASYRADSAAQTDYDFLYTGDKLLLTSIPAPFWAEQSYQQNSTRITSPDGKIKIDIIHIWDIAELMGVETPDTTNKRVNLYFRAVPLDIQAVAYRLVSRQLYPSMGLEAIKRGEIRVNNPQMLSKRRPETTIEEYGKEKARSMGFRFISPGQTGISEPESPRIDNTQPCYCDILKVWREGHDAKCYYKGKFR